MLDPYLLNYILMCLYAVNGGQFFVRGYWWDALYWLSALGITIAVTKR